jgi:hypothetical protein
MNFKTMRRRTTINNDPRIIACKFESVCTETGEVLKKGTRAIYYPASKAVFSLDSSQAQEFREWKVDIDNGYNY